MGALNINAFPYSNILVIIFAMFAGSLLGSDHLNRKIIFFAMLVAVSTLDIFFFNWSPE
ncbi:MAG: hypothetical protein ACYC7D_12515 [Nitrososphaerales archaeon]